MGVARLDDTHRRFDVFWSTPDKFYSMTLVYTGSRNYNRMINVEAEKQGLHMSMHGLVVAGTSRLCLEPRCEGDIMEYLGMPVLSPAQRDI